MDLKDKILDKLLEIIAEKVGEKFAILTAEELIKEIEIPLSQEELLNSFNSLKNKGLINLRYNDGKSFCCAITPKGKELFEKIDFPEKEDCKTKDKTPYFLIFLSAFSGGILGGIVPLIIRCFL